MAGVIALFLALTGHVGDRLTEVMNSAFWISLFLTIVLLGWLCWFEKSVIEAVFAAQNFAVSRNWLGLSIFVFALIITAVLYLIELFARWRFDRIIAIVDEQVTAGALTDALASLLEAQRLNDRWMSSRALRLSVLHRLSAVYRQTNYRAGYVDVEHRIKAIESSPEFISLEQRIMKEVLKGYKPDPGRLKDYAVVCVFAVLLLLAVCWLPPFATGETPLKEYFIRCLGAGLIMFVIAEAIAGKAHGGVGVTSHRRSNPYWFSVRAGVFLFCGIAMAARLDRVVQATHYWQLPGKAESWIVIIAGLGLCSLICYVLGYEHDKQSHD